MAPEEQDTSTTPQGQRARRKWLAAISVMALVVCVLLASAGGVVFASLSARPVALSSSLAPVSYHVITRVEGDPAGPAPTVQPTQQVTPPQTALGRVIYTLPTPTPRPVVPTGRKVILVSLSKQQLWAYVGNTAVFTTLVTTGRPELPTPTGTFTISEKLTDVTFISPWPQGSPYYYAPEHINYAMLFLTGGYFLHDATWHSDFGPGSNVPHTVNGVEETGSHGCVEMPESAAAWLYNWTPMGTTVEIVN